MWNNHNDKVKFSIFLSLSWRLKRLSANLLAKNFCKTTQDFFNEVWQFFVGNFFFFSSTANTVANAGLELRYHEFDWHQNQTEGQYYNERNGDSVVREHWRTQHFNQYFLSSPSPFFDANITLLLVRNWKEKIILRN